MGQGSSFVLQWAERAGRALGLDPLTFDPAFVAAQLPFYDAVFGPGRYFDTVVHGLDSVPEEPCMMVSNHGGGTTVTDGFGFATSWYRHFGVRRPLHGLLHEVPFAFEGMGHYLERCGMLRARPDTARRVLGDLRRDIIVMPGGDRDVWRPARSRYRVAFGGRLGYARTAIEAQVPVVPVAHVGAHHTLLVLSDGRRVAHALGLHRLVRAEVLPLHLALPWGLTFLPLPHLPPPTRFEYRLGKPIQPPSELTEEAVHDLDADVRRAIGGALDAMRREDRATGRRGVLAGVRRIGPGARDVALLVDRIRASRPELRPPLVGR